LNSINCAVLVSKEVNHLCIVFDVKNKNTKLIDFGIFFIGIAYQIVKYSTSFKQIKAAEKAAF
jgi:hypothetical protein